MYWVERLVTGHGWWSLAAPPETGAQRFTLYMARQAFANLPEGTSWDERPALKQVYLPSSHAKALDMNNQLVTGMRGAGKTFWWSALQESSVRQLVDQAGASSALNERTEVRIGFGLKPAIDENPSKDVLHQLMNRGVEPRIIWRTVQARQLAPHNHPIRQQSQWHERTAYVKQNPEAIDRLFGNYIHRFLNIRKSGGKLSVKTLN